MSKATINGVEYSAELSRGAGEDRTYVEIYADNVWAGTGWLSDKIQIEDCAADLGEDVYEALETAIGKDLAQGIGAEFDPTAR